MVTITINGKRIGREFPNMAHALTFAYQNGECYNAEKIEIVKTADKEGAKEPGQEQEETAAAVDSTDQTGATEPPQGDNAAGADAAEPPKDGDGSAKEAAVDSTDQTV